MTFQSVISTITLVLLCAISLSAQTSTPSSSLTERLNPVTQEWENIQQLTYEYNTTGEVIATVSEIWDESNQEWDAFSLTETDYDNAGNLLSTDTKVWNETNTEWTAAQRVDFTYSGTAQTSRAQYSWDADSDDWTQSIFEQAAAKNGPAYDHTQDIDTEYDAFGRATQSVITSNTNGETRSMRIVYTYAAKTNLAIANAASIQNFPNPVATYTSIQFELAEAASVSIQLYDTQGRLVTEIANGEMSEGAQSIDFDASNLPAANYLYTLIVDGAQLASNSMIVVGR